MTLSENQGDHMHPSEHDSDRDDIQVITLMRDAVRDVERPTQHLVQAAIRRGRRRRRLTRTVEAASGVAVVGAASVILVSTVATGHTADRAQTANSSSMSTQAPTHPHSAAAGPTAQSKNAALTPNVIIARAINVSPIGTFTNYADMTSAGAVGAAFAFNNGSDASKITIIVRRDQPAVHCQQSTSTCQRLANGTIVTEQVIGAVDHPTAITVTSNRSNGTAIAITEARLGPGPLVNVPNGRTLWVDDTRLAAWANAPGWTVPVTQIETAQAQRRYPIAGS